MNFLISCIILCIAMIPMAYQDWKEQQINVVFLIIFVLVALGILALETVPTPTISYAVGLIGLIITLVLGRLKKITTADVIVAGATCFVLFFVGTAALFIVIISVLFYSMNKAPRTYPFITYFLISVIFIMLAFFGLLYLVH